MSRFQLEEKPFFPDLFSNINILQYNTHFENYSDKYSSDMHKQVAKWHIEGAKDRSLAQQNSIRSNWDYRKYITKNADELIKQSFKEAAQQIGYYERQEINVNSYNPESFRVQGPPFRYNSYIQNDKTFGYSDSDLKRDYLAREQLHSRMVIPSMTKEQLMQLTPYRG
jgi:hypothetical protein